MAIVFANRGTFTAYYSTGSNIGLPSDSAAVTTAVDAGFVCGHSITMSATSNETVMWPGVGNAGATRKISMLYEYKPNYTGTPAANRPLFQLGLFRANRGVGLEFWHAVTTGKITVNSRDTTDNNVFASATFATAYSPTSGTKNDLYFEYDGTLTTNAIQFWVDNSSIGQLNASRALVSTWKAEYWSPMTFGATSNIGTASNVNIGEVVIWDTLNGGPGSIALDSGTGALNGASRTSMVAATNVNASSWTTLAASSILTGASQTQAGVVVNGTAVAGALFRNPSLAGT